MLYKEKVIQVKRVTKVVKGGKKMTVKALVVVGDFKNQVGLGVGSSEEASIAIEKAIFNGKKNLIYVPINSFYSISSKIVSSFGASKILLKPAPLGTGVCATGVIHAILELAGFKNIITKQLGSKNYLNNAKATLLALLLLNKF